jgi:hypothetical protein
MLFAMYWRVDNCSMVIPLSNNLSAILDFDSCSRSSLTNTNLRSASRIGTSSSRHGVVGFCMLYPFVQQDSKLTRSRNDCKMKLWRTAKVSFLNISPRTVQQCKSLTIIHSVMGSEALFLYSSIRMRQSVKYPTISSLLVLPICVSVLSI